MSPRRVELGQLCVGRDRREIGSDTRRPRWSRRPPLPPGTGPLRHSGPSRSLVRAISSSSSARWTAGRAMPPRTPQAPSRSRRPRAPAVPRRATRPVTAGPARPAAARRGRRVQRGVVQREDEVSSSERRRRRTPDRAASATPIAVGRALERAATPTRFPRASRLVCSQAPRRASATPRLTPGVRPARLALAGLPKRDQRVTVIGVGAEVAEPKRDQTRPERGERIAGASRRCGRACGRWNGVQRCRLGRECGE